MRIAPLALLCCLACAPSGPDPAGELNALFEREWEQRLANDPLLATSVGDHRFDDRLPSVSAEDHERRAERAEERLAELEAIDLDALGDEDRANAAIFRRQLEDRIAHVHFGAYQIPFSTDEGFHVAFAQLPSQVPLRTAEDYEAYLARLRAFPDYVDQHVENMRAGLARGFTMPRAVLETIEPTISTHVVDEPRESLFWGPFERMPQTIDRAERERLARAGEAAIAEAVVPAFRGFHAFFRDEYRPGARETIGATDLPDGEAYYAQRVRHYTTLELTPAEIHERGLAEVARIRAEMQTIIDEVGFQGDFEAFLTFLRTDPRFYADSPEALLKQAAWITKRMEAELPRLFGRLPRLPCAVEPVPPHLAPGYTSGRYVPAPLGSTEPGIYWVNTHALDSRPLYVLEALSLHEAVPGHHLQIALSQEQGDKPPFRRFDYISAYGEGWGLYAEWLGLEAGLYTDPYSDFGRLTYEMWRACRLVVDTGMHAMGWSRERARSYLAEHTALSLHEVGTEIDRYISWPAQALSYKIGELKIRELRARAERKLGAQFDLRDFHDVVLGTGSVPLPILERAVEDYLERRTGH